MGNGNYFFKFYLQFFDNVNHGMGCFSALWEKLGWHKTIVPPKRNDAMLSQLLLDGDDDIVELKQPDNMCYSNFLMRESVIAQRVGGPEIFAYDPHENTNGTGRWPVDRVDHHPARTDPTAVEAQGQEHSFASTLFSSAIH